VNREEEVSIVSIYHYRNSFFPIGVSLEYSETVQSARDGTITLATECDDDDDKHFVELFC
jgi:hypothetical protein